MKQAIVGYHQDQNNDWVAELACDHFQHVRHNPPWVIRPWVISEQGRASMLGEYLSCIKCDEGANKDK